MTENRHDKGPSRGGFAVFIPNLEGGGAERAMINLARGIKALGMPVDLIVGSSHGAYRSEIGDDINLVDLGASRLLSSLPKLVRYVASRRPRCVYSALDEANVIALLAGLITRSTTKIIPGLRNHFSEELAQTPSFKLKTIYYLARWLYAGAERLVAVSDDVAEDANQLLRIPRERISVIANPVITPELFERAAEPLDHPWFREGEPPVILACGRLAKQKDYPTLLRAFARLRRDQEARLMILGEGAEREALEKLVVELDIVNDVDFQGFVANPFRYMARARIFVLSSIFEGAPNVLVQALACGCAVVATDCPGGSKAILAGVPESTLVPVGDDRALHAAVDAFLDVQGPRPASRPPDGFDYLTSARSYISLADT